MPVYDKKSVKNVQDYLDAIAKIPGAERKAADQSEATKKKMDAAWNKLSDATKVVVSNIQMLGEATEEVDVMGKKLSNSFIKLRDLSRDLADQWADFPKMMKEIGSHS